MNKKANIWRKSRNSGKVLCYIEQGDILFNVPWRFYILALFYFWRSISRIF